MSFFFLSPPAPSGQYLNLDKDHNGMLSKEELSRYGTGTLTNIFLDRVFQECLTYDGEMVLICKYIATEEILYKSKGIFFKNNPVSKYWDLKFIYTDWNEGKII